MFSDWRTIQKDYNQILEDNPETNQAITNNYHQIWVKDLDRIDRCTTCHLEVDNNSENIPDFHKSHSKLYHDHQKWGCTICHEGQGLATNFADAHIPNESWDKPVLPNRYLESTCAKCHLNANLKETPTLNSGKQLVHDFNCNGCHDLPGTHDAVVPILDGIGAKVTGKNWIVHWLKEPKAFRPNTKMPNFFLSDTETETLADFLLNFTVFADSATLEILPGIYLQKKNDPNFVEQGKTLFREVNCISCHAVNGKGGDLAADLAKVASKAKEDWIYNFIKNPQLLQPGIEMPQFGFSNEQIASITAYISTEFFDWNLQQSDQSVAQSDSIEKGQKLFYQYNCIGCHQLSGIEIEQNRGPDNSLVGSKKLYQIYFENTTIPHTLHDYFYTRLNTPRIFGETMRMPKFNFSRKEKESINTYLLSLREQDLPDKFIKREAPHPEFNPQGEIGAIFKKFNCLKCHTINETGNTLAPDLSLVGSRLQKDWIRQFLRNPYSVRPMIEERMLKLFLTNEEIETIINYFYLILVEDSEQGIQAQDFSTIAQENGRQLYREKYGCQSCHKINGNGGSLGPALDNVDQRLQPEYMINWMLNPQKYIPNTIEPKSGMSLQEAQKIVAYLISL